MTFFASLALVFVLVIRPQEIWPWLAAFRLLDVFTSLVLLGLLSDLALRKVKQAYSPQLPFLGGFVATCYLASALAVGVGGGMAVGWARGAIPSIFMLAVMYGARTLPRLKTMLWLLVLLGGFVSAVAVHQGGVEPVCIERVLDEDGALNPDIEKTDGRTCATTADCREGRPDVEWACERLGMFKTFSTGRRVRWRGQLEDPNELSVFIGAIIPLLFAIALPAPGRTQSGARKALLTVVTLVVIGTGLYAVILSQSRGGQLVVATVFGFYFVSRLGKKGLLAAMVLALPVLLLGGRDDAEADASSTERLELLYEGVSLVFAHPLRGVGIDRFPDQVQSPLHLTAHNSYLLAAAEIGFPGFFFWLGLLWASFKVPLTALRTASLSPEIRSVAMALVVSFVGVAIGIFFLSFTFKQLLFVWFGLAGSFYGIVRQADPTVKVNVGWKDCFGIAAANVAIIGGLFVYTRIKGTG